MLAWALEKLLYLAQIWHQYDSVTNLKTPHTLLCDFRGNKTFTTSWSGSRVTRVQVWVQVWAPVGHLAISLKAVPEGNQRFRGQNQQPSSWGSSLALHGQVGLASTNTGCFQSLLQSAASHCRQQPASLRKTCYHSCDIDSVQRVKKILMFCKFPALTSVFFSCEIKFSMESARSCCWPKQLP